MNTKVRNTAITAGAIALTAGVLRRLLKDWHPEEMLSALHVGGRGTPNRSRRRRPTQASTTSEVRNRKQLQRTGG